jgi:type VI secretion system protein ImpA
MPLREDILSPVAGENPGGTNLRYDPVYDKLKEAMREEEDLAQGAWQRERKVADHALVIRLASEAIATRSKDIQLAVWLTESLLKKEGFGGFLDGLELCRNLLDKFWDNLQPRDPEDDDVGMRAAPLDYIGTRLLDTVKQVPLNRAGHSWFKLTEARTLVGYEKDKTGDAKKTREKLITKEGKLAPEDFDKSFGETPKAFYATAEKTLDALIVSLEQLSKVCEERFGDDAPTFGKLTQTVQEVRHSVHGLLEKKRETEPDPVEEAPVEEAAAAEEELGLDGEPAAPGAPRLLSVAGPQEPADRRQAIEQAAAAASALRKREPRSPAPYLMMRGLRWGELRYAVESKDATMLEAPPTELRQSIKMLALKGKWKDLLEAAEAVMCLPCSRGWLDLQRFVVEACTALGSDYDAIARALRTELRALLRDVPQILDATLLDDTPAANAETQTWLRSLIAEPEATAPPPPPGAHLNGDAETGWQKKYVDAYQLAKEAIAANNSNGAIDIMQREVERQRSGRGRFLRRLQLVDLCLSTGKEAIAQPILEDMLAALDAHKLEDWEDRDMVASALVSIVKANKRIQGDAKEKAKMFDRLCRLNPARALEI